jgi:hypothetical protein
LLFSLRGVEEKGTATCHNALLRGSLPLAIETHVVAIIELFDLAETVYFIYMVLITAKIK